MPTSEFDYIARETQLPFAGDRGTVTASLEEIRYAELLRARLRESLLSRSAFAAPAWGVGAD